MDGVCCANAPDGIAIIARVISKLTPLCLKEVPVLHILGSFACKSKNDGNLTRARLFDN
jgi:hypothetical protein